MTNTARRPFHPSIGLLTAGRKVEANLIGHNRPEIVVERCEPDLIARRMAVANLYEQRKLLDYYQAFRFAFPDSRNELLELSTDRHAEMLSGALADKETLLVSHPYGGPLDRLGQRIIECL